MLYLAKSLARFLYSALELGITLIGADRGFIMLIREGIEEDRSEPRLVVACSHGLDNEAYYGLHFALGEGVAGYVAQSGQGKLVESVDQEPLFVRSEQPFRDGRRVRSLIVLPLRYRDQVVGVLNLDWCRSRGSSCFKTKPGALEYAVATDLGRIIERGWNQWERAALRLLAQEQGRSLLAFKSVPGKGQLPGPKHLVERLFELCHFLVPSADATFLFRRRVGGESGQVEMITGIDGPPGAPVCTYLLPWAARLLEEHRVAAMIGDLHEHRLVGYQPPPNFFRCLLVVPIWIGDDLAGGLAVASRKPYAFNDLDFVVLGELASRIALFKEWFCEADEPPWRRAESESLEGVIILDRRGYILSINARAEKILGIPSREMLGQQVGELVCLEGREKVEERLRRLWEDEEPIQGLDLQLYWQRRRIAMKANISVLRNRQGDVVGATAIIYPASQGLPLEQYMKQAERLAAAGELAAGAAHEIRNPLTAIRGFVQLLQNTLEANDRRREMTSIIIDEVDRLDSIVKQLLMLSRPQVSQFGWVQLNELIDEVHALVYGETMLKEIDLKCGYDLLLPPIWADAYQLKQVFLNLIINAIQAMPGGGKLTITTHFLAEEKSVAVKVADTGCGIPADALDRIFDPFYTLKPNGTGLGLAVARRMVEDHGGEIKVDSKVGGGSIFTIRLPIKLGVKSS